MRQHSLKTSYLIHKVLVDNDLLLEKVQEKNIYLAIAEAETEFPYVIIKRTGVNSNKSNKDFWSDTVFFSITIYSEDYESGCEVADLIRMILENNILENEDLDIRLENIYLTSATENWVSDSYEQQLNFSAEVLKAEK